MNASPGSISEPINPKVKRRHAMVDELFTAALALVLALLFSWSFRALPDESWQFIGAVPRRKGKDGAWSGLNLTYYGFFNANAYALATAIFLILFGATGVPLHGAMALVAMILCVCMPASKILAGWVEKKKHTFSVAGAAFIGVLITPAAVFIVNRTVGASMGFSIEFMAALAALAVAYAFGEGVGRLACISFGCCYGRPLATLPPRLRRLFQRRAFVFSGATKKIAYAHGLDGKPVVPIQAMTAVLYSAAGILGFYLFLKGLFVSAFFEALVTTQVWRFLSEFLRHDYRGGGKISAYQIMGVGSILYAVALGLLFPGIDGARPDLMAGLAGLYTPPVLISLQVIWIAGFLYTGRSRVTDATLFFNVVRNRI
jgi:hypothetical protein